MGVWTHPRENVIGKGKRGTAESASVSSSIQIEIENSTHQRCYATNFTLIFFSFLQTISARLILFLLPFYSMIKYIFINKNKISSPNKRIKKNLFFKERKKILF